MTASLEDKDAVKSLGINVDKYFSIVFVIGSCLAALGPPRGRSLKSK